MKLVIVESPTKARKLSEYLGKGFDVQASMGHIRDLPKSKLGVDVNKNFEPEYILVKGKGEVIKKLKASAKKSESIYLAMDPDREGEAIAWHVRFALGDGKGTDKKFKRVTFNEITKEAILSSMDEPGDIDIDLVDAQQARRIVDRLVGYTLSPVLWKKVRRGLSAGRVQSVALRLVVEKEEEIDAFKPQEYWDILVDLLSKKNKFGASLHAIDGEKAPKDGFLINSEKQAEKVTKDLKKADYVVKFIQRRERKIKPYAPFTTSTLQQAAANMYGWSAKQTMATAQKLYEEGAITYHRTDSLNMSKSAISAARKLIEKEYGKEYLPEKSVLYQTKSKGAQEAHEAIRPTDMTKSEINPVHKMTSQHTKLYALIWRRAVASQMVAAVYDATTIAIEAKKDKKTYDLKTVGSIRKFDGWRKLFKRLKDDVILPELTEGEKLKYKDLTFDQKFTQPPARYNDAGLIKALEERGIGRPSTYAPTISTIIARGYVERKEKRFHPTVVGKTVIKFLKKNFKDIIDYDFTAEMEEDLDRVARGEKKWKPLTGEFWKPFKKKIDEVEKNAKRVGIPVEKTGEKCPDCKKGDKVIRTGRFGKFYSCSTFPECKFTDTYTETVDGMKCEKCKKGDVVVKRTRKGRSFYGCSEYPKCDWASWSKPTKKKE
ncbi:type I DNA topoisomerase [Patescibacteria group bacterium]